MSQPAQDAPTRDDGWFTDTTPNPEPQRVVDHNARQSAEALSGDLAPPIDDTVDEAEAGTEAEPTPQPSASSSSRPRSSSSSTAATVSSGTGTTSKTP